MLSAANFLELGLETVGFNLVRQQKNGYACNLRRFRSSYGASPVVYSAIFTDLQTTEIAAARINKPKPQYFLMSMYWMFTYATEIQLAAKFFVNEKTAREHIWKYAKAVAALKAQKVSNDSSPGVLTSKIPHI